MSIYKIVFEGETLNETFSTREEAKQYAAELGEMALLGADFLQLVKTNGQKTGCAGLDDVRFEIIEVQEQP